MLLGTLVLLLCLPFTKSFRTSFYPTSPVPDVRRQQLSSQLRSSAYGASVPSDGEKFWKQNVQYVDMTSTILPSSDNVREIPLFLLGGAFFPQGNTFLHVFEMKYRTMMYDLSQSDDIFGYIHSDGGQIASIGTLCKITQRQLLDDGRQYIELEGIGRFRVRKVTKTLPYIVAEVEPGILDSIPEDSEMVEKMEKEVYDNLKYYMRLMRSVNPNKDVVISQKAKQFAPSKFADKQDRVRRENFSFSLANMIQMASQRESQLLLQTMDSTKRLEVIKMMIFCVHNCLFSTFCKEFGFFPQVM